MPGADVRELVLAEPIAPEREDELLRPYGFRDPRAAGRELRSMAADPTSRAGLAQVLPELLASLAGCADADGALLRLERFLRASGGPASVIARLLADRRMIDVLTRAFGASPFMAEVLTRHPRWFDPLAEPGGLARTRTRDEMERDLAAALGAIGSDEPPLDALRLAKRREILHIGLRDLAGLATVEETVGALSRLGETLIEAAAVAAEDAVRTQLQLRPRAGGRRGGRARTGFTVLALGKLGGGELNFSSDVDLVYLYDKDAGRAPGERSGPGRADYFHALARGLTSTLGDVTAEGQVYRVDLRLRPEGGSGSVAHSLPSFERYYRSRGATWERMALVKAWPVAGDRALGRLFLERVQPFVYGRGLDAAGLEDVRRLKRQIDRKLAQRTGGQRHVKLGVGGIREIEFVCQVMQVRFGSRQRSLRERSTLGALQALHARGLLAVEEQDALERAYLFLRDVENKLQMAADTQVHTLPDPPEELHACARGLGYRDGEARRAEDALLSDYRAHTEATHRIFEEVLAGPRLKL